MEVTVFEVNSAEVIKDLMPLDQLTEQKQALAVIDSPEAAVAAGQYLREVRTAIRKIKAKYVKIRKPVNDALKDLKKQEAEDLAPYLAAEVSVNAPLLAWQVEERVQVEEHRKAQLARAREAEQKRRDETVKELIAQSETLRGFERTVVKAQAKALSVAPLVPRISEPIAEPTKIPGVSLREYWHAEVGDLLVLVQAVAAGRAPLAALEANQDWLDEQAEALGAELSYPGVTAVKTHGQTARGL